MDATTLRARPGSWLLPLAVGFVLSAAAGAQADPAWWTGRGVVDAQLAKDDYALINVGQLKHMAAEARNELNAFLPGGAGAPIDALVGGWANTSSADHYAVWNLGRLKAVGKLFWDRLIAVSGATAYPWTASTGDDDSYASANLGQLKRVFNFESDMDHDGFADWWEVQTAGSIAVLNGDGVADADGDGISDLAESQIGWNPVSSDLNSAAKTESLSYDGASRLVSVSGRSVLGYAPDAAGNLVQATHP